MWLPTVVTLFMSIRIVHPVPACKISEFSCRNSKCIRLDRFCDGVNDCGDKSDEPLYCSACNRTYYGEIKKTYDLELPKPREDRLPFLCHLTFTANGHIHGDFIQITFDAFQVGRFEENTSDNCRDGYMQIMELGRPFTGGSWCGTSQGHAVYYSETSTITATIKLFHSPQNTNFQFRIRYKFLSQDEAIVRYGTVSAPLETGEIVPGTYCSRNFYDCYRKRCKLQSPNFPGFYPRNVTCHLILRQKTIPTCKHAMITVEQQNAHKIQIKRSVRMASINKTRELKTWSDCNDARDHIIFYDGPSTDDPVLVKYCGGDWLPRIISRGPELLAVFRSTEYSIPLGTTPDESSFTGFELDVNVMFADSDSLDFIRQPNKCEFWINATNPDGDEIYLRSKGRQGYMISPRHTLSPNTTCTWHFKGQPEDFVWIYFISYVQIPFISLKLSEDTDSKQNKDTKTIAYRKLIPTNITHSCSTRLRIWDGGGRGGEVYLLGDFCDHQQPRMCDHTSLSNLTRYTRPCTMDEGYISRGPNSIIQLQSIEGTALHPAMFRLWYEFVDTRLGGDPWPVRRTEDFPPSPCIRVYRRHQKGHINSPRNVFYYGRGGGTNLTCIYRIESGPSERIKLTIVNASFGENECVTDSHPHTLRPRCVRESNDRIIELKIFESPWKEVIVPHSCFCDNTTLSNTPTDVRPFVIISSSRALEIHFTISEFNITEDYTHLFFHADFEMIQKTECSRKQKIRGSGGEIEFANPPTAAADISCAGIPWYVEAHENHSLFLLTWGTFLHSEPTAEELLKCSTKNRVLVYSGKPPRLMRVVCPQSPNEKQYAVHVFSEEWFGGSSSIPQTSDTGPIFHLRPPRPPSFIVEFVGSEDGVAQLNWLEISRSRSSYYHQLVDLGATPHLSMNETLNLLPGSDCTFKCPELNACISSSLWCDGRINCPSGYDELEIHCGVGHKFISLVPGGLYAILGASAAFLTFCCLFIAVAITYRMRKSQRKKYNSYEGYRNGPPRRLPTDEMLLDPNSTLSS